MINQNTEYRWTEKIKNILRTVGRNDLWIYQENITNKNIHRQIKQTLIDQFKQTWVTTVFDSPKCLNYRIFKTVHTFEKYITYLPYDLRKAFCNYRCINHRLPIEQGRFWGVERDDRLCDLCNLGELGDEFHYIFNCKFFSKERKTYLPEHIATRPNVIKYSELFCSDDYNTIVKLAKFCKIILSIIN